MTQIIETPRRDFRALRHTALRSLGLCPRRDAADPGGGRGARAFRATGGKVILSPTPRNSAPSSPASSTAWGWRATPGTISPPPATPPARRCIAARWARRSGSSASPTTRCFSSRCPMIDDPVTIERVRAGGRPRASSAPARSTRWPTRPICARSCSTPSRRG